MHANSLINETSPYLLQHAHNPVNWFAWNDETLEKAKKENKMLLISVGYAACHWCHVMEHESFENEEVAKIMNEHYVCVKVDREERPDVDQVYMDAAYLINGSGGWPLNALSMPDGRPFFAGAYYPKENWVRLLEYFAGIYKNEKQKLEDHAENLLKGIHETEKIPLNQNSVMFHENNLNEMFANFQKRMDWERGGTKGSMKFPMPSIWEFLLQYHYFTGHKEAVQAAEITLENMALGGIYDQVGGGFSRYATDTKWHAPHFEKMLYDNAQLVSLYSHAFQLTKNPLYKRIVFETLAFVSRELTIPEGGFYSSLDADSEGEEGKYYVWAENEIKEILQKDADLYSNYYGITPTGNWDHQKNIPDINYGNKSVAEKYGLTEFDLQEKLISLNKSLLAEREKRICPGTDDKILTSWNALMAKGFIDAYKAFGVEEFLNSAKRNIDFLLQNVCTKHNSLFRNFKNGKATIPAFLDDYAFLISALIDFYQVSFEEKYLQKAKELNEYAIENFLDKDSGMFFYTDKKFSNLIVRKMEVTDNVIPSSNSEMAKNLFVLSMYFENKDLKNKSAQLVKNVMEDVKKNSGYYSNWAIAAALHVYTPFEIAIVGDEWKNKLSELQKNYLPNAIFLGGDNEGTLSLLQGKLAAGKTIIYICKNKTCGMPVGEVSEALKQMKK